MQSTASNRSFIFYQLRAFETTLTTGETSSLSLLCRYRCLKLREQSLPAQTEEWRGKTACLTRLQPVQSRREQQLWYYSFIYGDCYLSFGGGDTFYLTVADSWWGAELRKSTQVHILLMVLLFGRTGPSLFHSPKQVMDLDPNECLTMRGSALTGLSTKWFMLLMRLWGRRQ